ncbi:blue-sensitive opsin P467-like [Ylistrum balloti]|uniref:blue-sensitive opsin P467-like n=1 Tax=Ylistrum balloti TaxID=509963 RepID=UPI0029057FFC|nr:blue-sensitive opsin P467-like [Ylistrum balloti]
MDLTTDPTSNFTTLLNVSFKPPPLIYVNDHVAQTLLPVTVVLWFYIAIGVLGNSLVMFVYWARKKPVREDRYFIPLLALVDLLSCVVSSGTGIYAQTYPLIFDNDFGCKMAAFLGILFASTSADFLLVIAVERYIKLCRPFGRQMTIYIKKILIVVTCVVGLILSAPALDVYKVEQVPMKIEGGIKLQTWKCIDKMDEKHVTGHMIYKIVLFMVTVVRFGVLFFCYGNIIKKLYNHSKHRQRLGSFLSCTNTSITSTEDTENHVGLNQLNQQSMSADDANEKNETAINGKPNQKVGTEPRKVSGAAQKVSKRKQSVVSMTGSLGRRGSMVDRQGIRLTLIFILVTLIYVITYGPKVWLMLEQTVNRDFWSSIPPSRLVFYRFLHTFYIFNNIVNPIVYGIMDKRFRSDCQSRLIRCKK